MIIFLIFAEICLENSAKTSYESFVEIEVSLLKLNGVCDKICARKHENIFVEIELTFVEIERTLVEIELEMV